MTETKNKLNVYFSVNPAEFSQVAGEPLLVAEIPINWLLGIQPINEYSEGKRRKTLQLYDQEGVGVLKRFPIYCCALPNNPSNDDSLRMLLPETPYMLIILDGHHRVRFGSLRNILIFNTNIYSVEQAFNGFRKLGKNPTHIKNLNSIPDFIRDLNSSINTTLDSFIRRGFTQLPISVIFNQEEISSSIKIKPIPRTI